MNRRGFIAGCLSLPLLRRLGRKSEDEEEDFFDGEEEHFFDWGYRGREGPYRDREGPFTTHPRYKKTLETGWHHRTYLNGEEFLGLVKRMLTGPRGWVEVNVLDENGDFVITSDDEIAVKLIYGNVQYRDFRVDPPLKGSRRNSVWTGYTTDEKGCMWSTWEPGKGHVF